MYSLLNFFAMVGQALNTAPFLVLSPLLEDVIYGPIRAGTVPWPGAFESLILYLTMVESRPSDFSLANVYIKAGGIDTIRDEARTVAAQTFPSSIFRPLGGNPGGPLDRKQSESEVFSGNLIGFSEKSKRGCTAWNLDKPHLAKHVQNGRCVFTHKCDQFVSDKGPGGQCLGSHRRKDCDYELSKRRSTPLAA